MDRGLAGMSGMSARVVVGDGAVCGVLLQLRSLGRFREEMDKGMGKSGGTQGKGVTC